jgi:hypothetical protein
MKTFNLIMNVKAYDLTISVVADTKEEAITNAERELLGSLNLLNQDAFADAVSVNVVDDEQLEESSV